MHLKIIKDIILNKSIWFINCAETGTTIQGLGGPENTGNKLIFSYISCRNISFEAIQNGSKSNWVLHVWTEVSHQIFSCSEVQTMWNLQKNEWFLQRRMF